MTNLTYQGITNNIMSSVGSSPTYFDYSPFGPLAQDSVKDGSAPAAFLLKDLHGDVIGTSNASGVASSSWVSYSPWGEIVGSSVGGTSPTQPYTLGFQGQLSDPTTGFTKTATRFYDPSMGTFTAQDSLFGNAIDPNTLNQYAYGNDSPVDYTDPSGMHGSGRANACDVECHNDVLQQGGCDSACQTGTDTGTVTGSADGATPQGPPQSVVDALYANPPDISWGLAQHLIARYGAAAADPAIREWLASLLFDPPTGLPCPGQTPCSLWAQHVLLCDMGSTGRKIVGYWNSANSGGSYLDNPSVGTVCSLAVPGCGDWMKHHNLVRAATMGVGETLSGWGASAACAATGVGAIVAGACSIDGSHAFDWSVSFVAEHFGHTDVSGPEEPPSMNAMPCNWIESGGYLHCQGYGP